MKKRVSLSISLFLQLLLFLAVSCSKDDAVKKPDEGKVEFSILSSETSGGRSKALQALIVTIKDASGKVIHDRKKLQLIKFGEEYLSEPISLTIGDFTLTEFLVVDENNAAIYACPIAGSPMAYLVKDPLPINIKVVKDQVTKITPQLIKIDGATAIDFGYVTFGLDIVKTFKFSVGIFTYNTTSHNFELANANVSVYSPTAEVLFNKDLTAITNEVTVKDDYSTYKIKVIKNGYQSYEKIFTLTELKAFVSTPLMITLLTQSLTEGLIAYYPFNGTAEDVTTNNFDGIIHGAILTTDRKGVINSSYAFDGIDDYINVPHNQALNLSGDFSISLWVQVAAVQEPHEGINDILRKWNGTAEGYPFSISYLNPLAADDVEDKIIYVRYDGQGCAHAPTTFSPLVTNDVFAHIVLIKSGSKLRHYYNNVLIEEINDTTSSSSCSINNTADMTIACRGNLVRFFKGKIDDIRIYNRAVSSDEVANLFGE